MNCHNPERDHDCALCLAKAGEPCPMQGLDTSHQGRAEDYGQTPEGYEEATSVSGAQPVADEVSPTPESALRAHEAVIDIRTRRRWHGSRDEEDATRPRVPVDLDPGIRRGVIQPLERALEAVRAEEDPEYVVGLLMAIVNRIVTQYCDSE